MATKKILIVIDVQNDFITGTLRNEEAIKRLPNIVSFVKNEKFDETYVTLDTHTGDYLKTLEGKNLPVKHCIKNTSGWKMPKEMEDALKNQNVMLYAEKPTFGSTYLNGYLHATMPYNDICEFTIVGFCTDICVVSNALMLRANFPNSRIIVRKDCTAGITKESEEAALNTMKMCQIEIV